MTTGPIATVVLDAASPTFAETVDVVRATVAAASLEVTVIRGAKPDREEPWPIPREWRSVRPRPSGLLEAARAAASDIVVVVPSGIVPEVGCISELLLALLNDDHLGFVGARVATQSGVVVEAGAHLWRDLGVKRYGFGGRRDDPRWSTARNVDTVLAGVYAVRRDLLLGNDAGTPVDMLDLGLRAEAAGLRASCPAGAWAQLVDSPSAQADLTELDAVVRATLQQRHAATLAGHLPEEMAGAWLGSRPSAACRVLLCDRWLPRPDRHAGERRMIDLMTTLRALGCPVTLVCFSGLRWQPYSADFERIGVEVFCPAIGEDGYAYALERLEELSAQRPGLYDLAIVPWPELFERASPSVRRLFPAAFLVYDCIDLHHARMEQQRLLRSDVSGIEVAKTRERELSAVRWADLTLVVSAAEQNRLHELVPGSAVRRLPLVYELGGAPGPADRADMLFVGGFGHPPNVDGIIWFVDEILPLIRSRRQAKLIVVGADAPPEVVALEAEDVQVVGHAPDVDAWYDRARVFVSPLRFGAGVKGKSVQALARGLPLVTTVIGIEGTAVRDGEEALVRDDPDAFAEGVVSLLDDDDLWSRMALKQVALATRDHSPAMLLEMLQPVLDMAVAHSRPVAPGSDSAAVVAPARGGRDRR